ncbi:MAG: hypothetical protein VR65_03025 [Desulfobulbaceae bacterium BRH_c16a]|nr:MAG: hypothetical protein VR65_03025 [Desulfobulbaceae bacterium BRH_c16a]
MSYILDALKKSDRERQQEMPPHLQPLHGTLSSSKSMSVLRRRRWPWLLVSGFLIIGGLLKWSDWNRQKPEGQFHLQSSPAEMTVLQEPVVQASPSSTLAVPEALDPVTIDPQKFDDWYQHLPKKENTLLPESPQSAVMERKSAGHVLSPAEASLADTYSKTFTEPIRIKRDREKILMSQPDEATVIVHPVSSGKPERELPYLHDLPPQIQTNIPKMQFAGHAYAHAPSKRMIIINGKIMREGDRLDTGTRLAEITWEGAIIDNNGVRFQVKCY